MLKRAESHLKLSKRFRDREPFQSLNFKLSSKIDLNSGNNDTVTMRLLTCRLAGDTV